MCVFKKQALVESFPAYDVFEREADYNGLVQITVDDILGLDSGKGFYRRYQPGSVASCALQYNECPIRRVEETLEKAKKFPYAGHKLWWLNQCASVLSDGPRAKESLVMVKVGMIVNFEGRKFRLVGQPNNNLGFESVE